MNLARSFEAAKAKKRKMLRCIYLLFQQQPNNGRKYILIRSEKCFLQIFDYVATRKRDK